MAEHDSPPATDGGGTRSAGRPSTGREGAFREQPNRSPEAERERKERVLTQGTPSTTRSIASAVVIKDGDLFFLCEPSARVPLDRWHGLGLYYHDCRYLNGYDLKLARAQPNLLVASAAAGFSAVFEFSNPDIRMERGGVIPSQDVGVRWERIVDGSKPALHDRIAFQNYGLAEIEFPVSLTFRAEFEDIFVVRGLLAERPGTLWRTEWRDGALRFGYAGADGVHRTTTIRFSPRPDRTGQATAEFRLWIGPGAVKELLVDVRVAESTAEPGALPTSPGHAAEPIAGATRRPSAGTARPPSAGATPAPTAELPDLAALRRALQRASDRATERHMHVRTNSLLLNSILERSFRDLHMLRSRRGDSGYIAAGLPWFGTLFGRDSIVTALQTLAYAPEIAAETLRILAAHQGTTTDDWRDEQPGKILHEIRIGEFARMGEVPHTPYYGTVDATPLFLILLGRYVAWTGDVGLFTELGENVDRALEWVRRYGDLDGDGYIEYRSESRRGLINQGWKDSGDAICNADGRLAEPPIALVEVQGYVYLAQRMMAELYRRQGERERGERLEREAADLRERFERDYWIEALGTYALALQAGRRPAAVVSSNPGHALWAGIADEARARRTVERLMAEDMFSGWGVRTLSTRERRYNPIGYHLGTVWPHDNAFIAAGFRRYGFDREALRIVHGLLQAAIYFQDFRLPELFAGFGRDDFHIPVSYPVACHPQAWAAGSIPYLLETLLGLVPEALEHRLRIGRPLLPDIVDRVHIQGLRVGDARADLHFERVRDGVSVQVLDRIGDLDILVEPAATAVGEEVAP